MASFITDENLFPKVVEFLRSRQHDVKDVRESFRGASDEEIARIAKEDKRILLTFDKHFANILRYPPDAYYGIVRIRIHPPVLRHVMDSLQMFINDFGLAKMKGKLIILERDGYRIHPREE